MVRTAKQAREKWQERIAISGKYMKEGIESPREDWEEQSLKAAPKRDAELRKAIDEGRIDAGIKKVGTEKWQRRALEVGVNRWATEAPKAGKEYEDGISDVIDCVEVAKRTIDDMPETTVEQRAEKSKQYQIAMSKCMTAKRGY